MDTHHTAKQCTKNIMSWWWTGNVCAQIPNSGSPNWKFHWKLHLQYSNVWMLYADQNHYWMLNLSTCQPSRRLNPKTETRTTTRINWIRMRRSTLSWKWYTRYMYQIEMFLKAQVNFENIIWTLKRNQNGALLSSKKYCHTTDSVNFK